MNGLKWWMRSVGVLYLLMFVIAVFVRLPIRVMGPPGVLDRAAAGDPTARLLVDTWVTLGLEFGIVGAALCIASRVPEQARVFVCSVIGIEFVRGMGTDAYMIAHGYAMAPQAVWLVIHSVIVATGIRCLQRVFMSSNNAVFDIDLEACSTRMFPADVRCRSLSE